MRARIVPRQLGQRARNPKNRGPDLSDPNVPGATTVKISRVPGRKKPLRLSQ